MKQNQIENQQIPDPATHAIPAPFPPAPAPPTPAIQFAKVGEVRQAEVRRGDFTDH